jgi:hypothetical protein
MPILALGGVKVVMRIFPPIVTFETAYYPLTVNVNNMGGATVLHSK